MENNQQIIEQEVLQETSKAIEQVDAGDFNALQNAAKNFLKQINILFNARQKILSKATIQDKITALYAEMKKDTEYTRLILEYQHIFEISLNQFLERTIYLTYVNKDGSLISLDDFAIGQLYKKATRGNGRGNLSGVRILEMKTIENEIQKEINKSAKSKNEVYITAIERYNKNKSELYMNYNISKNTFYWWAESKKVLGGWTSPLANKGWIAEGYADAVINEDDEISNSSIETSLHDLWEKHIQVNNTSGVVKGDIVMTGQNNLQFAIKSGNFSTAKVGQYINLANNILQLKRLTVQEFNQYANSLIKINKTSNNILNLLNEKAEQAAVEQMKSVQNK